MGREVHSRTLSLSATLTTRSRGDPPDWLLWARRPPPPPREPEADACSVTSEIDVTSRTAALKDDGDAIADALTVAADITVQTHADPEETLQPTTLGDQTDPNSLGIIQVRRGNSFGCCVC